MASAKVENYSAEVTTSLVNGYTVENKTVEALAAEFGKSVKSVVAKLVREGVYKSKEVVKSKRVTKADLVAKVAKDLGLAGDTLESLEKATHEALEALDMAVTMLVAEKAVE